LGHIARGCKNTVNPAFGEDENWGAQNAHEPSNIALMPQAEPSTIALMPQAEPSTVALVPLAEPSNVAQARYCSFLCLFYCDMQLL
jgi:hypothetical protein